MKDYEIGISRLKIADLSSYPHDAIKQSIQQFGKFGAIIMTLHKGKTLIRARPNQPGEIFSTRAELSYKPQKFNTSYQRASTPYQTMFYAGTIPEDVKIGELDNARFVASLEASNLLRDTEREGEQTITFSKWAVTDDIPLFAICYHKDFISKSSHTKKLNEAYEEQLKSQDADMQQKSHAITEFLASEFAKYLPHDAPDYHYMISAVFTEAAILKGVAGVYYPSVRAEGMGFNVAINPEYTDSHLKLVAAGECIMYKRGKHTIVDNDTVCIIEDDTQPFTFVPVSDELKRGKDKILQELNMA